MGRSCVSPGAFFSLCSLQMEVDTSPIVGVCVTHDTFNGYDNFGVNIGSKNKVTGSPHMFLDIVVPFIRKYPVTAYFQLTFDILWSA